MEKSKMTIHTVFESLKVEYDGDTWRGDWVSYVMNDGNETYDRFLQISRKDDDKFIQLASSSELDPVRDCLVKQKIDNLRTQYNLLKSLSLEEEEIAIKDILKQAWDGEWMGQPRDSLFYAYHLAAILKRDEFDLLDWVRSSDFAGLNGFIIIPKEQETTQYRAQEERTGHKQFDVNDYGDWSCLHCKNFTFVEDNISPESIPCIPPTEISYTNKKEVSE